MGDRHGVHTQPPSPRTHQAAVGTTWTAQAVPWSRDVHTTATSLCMHWQEILRRPGGFRRASAEAVVCRLARRPLPRTASTPAQVLGVLLHPWMSGAVYGSIPCILPVQPPPVLPFPGPRPPADCTALPYPARLASVLCSSLRRPTIDSFPHFISRSRSLHGHSSPTASLSSVSTRLRPRPRPPPPPPPPPHHLPRRQTR